MLKDLRRTTGKLDSLDFGVLPLPVVAVPWSGAAAASCGGLFVLPFDGTELGEAEYDNEAVLVVLNFRVYGCAGPGVAVCGRASTIRRHGHSYLPIMDIVLYTASHHPY